jgi:hypothetical protein
MIDTLIRGMKLIVLGEGVMKIVFAIILHI